MVLLSASSDPEVMTIVNNDDQVISCCTDDCRKSFATIHGWKVHYGQKHEKKKTECVTCGEMFADRHAGQKKQCLDCVQTHGARRNPSAAD